MSLTSSTSVADNLREVMSFIGCDYEGISLYLQEQNLCFTISHKWSENCNQLDLAVVSVIKELCLQREGNLTTVLTSTEANELLYALCTG